MAAQVLRHVLPEGQRRTLDELKDTLDLSSGDHQPKKSAYWTMLTLSAVIASAGVLSDSTATVIGAMIIAPLSTPIMGFALGLATGRLHGGLRSSVQFTGLGALLVIAVGVLFSLVLPGTYNLTANEQIAGRTSPGLLDLIAAIATGFAGAIALARRDVAAVLPGVAISISLVPPLAVVGVCLGEGSWGLALGALTLFISNLLALVLAGTLVFTALRLNEHVVRPQRRVVFAITALLVVVGIPLATNTALTYLLAVYTDRVHSAAVQWLEDDSSARVTEVQVHSNDIVVDVRTAGELPDIEGLVGILDGRVPPGYEVVVATTQGERIEAGFTS